RDEDVVRASPGEIAGELPEGPLGLVLAGQDLALDHDLGPGGDVEVDRLRSPELHGLAEEPADPLELRALGSRIGQRAHSDRGVQADGDGALEAPPPFLRSLLEL